MNFFARFLCVSGGLPAATVLTHMAFAVTERIAQARFLPARLLAGEILGLCRGFMGRYVLENFWPWAAAKFFPLWRKEFPSHPPASATE